MPKRLTKQQRYIKKRRQQGLCILCPELAEPNAHDPTKTGPYCTAHKVENRERARTRIGAKKRWKNASSY